MGDGGAPNLLPSAADFKLRHYRNVLVSNGVEARHPRGVSLHRADLQWTT